MSNFGLGSILLMPDRFLQAHPFVGSLFLDPSRENEQKVAYDSADVNGRRGVDGTPGSRKTNENGARVGKPDFNRREDVRLVGIQIWRQRTKVTVYTTCRNSRPHKMCVKVVIGIGVFLKLLSIFQLQ